MQVPLKEQSESTKNNQFGKNTQSQEEQYITVLVFELTQPYIIKIRAPIQRHQYNLSGFITLASNKKIKKNSQVFKHLLIPTIFFLFPVIAFGTYYSNANVIYQETPCPRL